VVLPIFFLFGQCCADICSHCQNHNSCNCLGLLAKPVVYERLVARTKVVLSLASRAYVVETLTTLQDPSRSNHISLIFIVP
jgi:hypothetical protein